MSDYKPHPEDTQQVAIDCATKALVSARPTNRYYIFPMADRVEIAFGNARHLTSGGGEEGFSLSYHSAISMDESMMRDLHLSLTNLISILDKTNA